MDRIAFIKLGISVVVSEAWLSGCADDGDDGQANGGAGAGGSENPPSGGAGAGAGNPATSGAGGAAAGLAAGASNNAGSGGSATAECTTDANLVQTSMESHDHLPLTTPITAAQLNAGSPTEYALPLEQNHIHTLTFTDADFEKLRSGMILSKRSSTAMGHTHTYSIKCV